MQDEIEFAGADNKKIMLTPSASIKEVGFEMNGSFQKMEAFKGKDFEKTTSFSDDDYKFIRIAQEGKINSYIFYKKTMAGGIQQFMYFRKMKTRQWSNLTLTNRKKVAAEFFNDCPQAMANFESHSELWNLKAA